MQLRTNDQLNDMPNTYCFLECTCVALGPVKVQHGIIVE